MNRDKKKVPREPKSCRGGRTNASRSKERDRWKWSRGRVKEQMC